MKTKHIVMVGSLNDGFKAHGSFDTWDDAADYADWLDTMLPTWVMEMNTAKCDGYGNWVE